MEKIEDFIDFIIEIIVAIIGVIVEFVNMLRDVIFHIKFEYMWWKISRHTKKELRREKNGFFLTYNSNYDTLSMLNRYLNF
jgi:hypothetical protein